MLLRRGFKAFAEKKSLEFRAILGLKDVDFLDAFLLAQHLGITIKCASEFLGNGEEFLKLCSTDSGWSAARLINEIGEQIIIHNTRQSVYRQQSNLMHEIAHVVCEHDLIVDPEQDKILANLFIRPYNKTQEEEAEVLGAALQIPRDGLVKHLYKAKSIEEISEIYQASRQMVQFRINNTGAKFQVHGRANRKK